VLPSTLLFISGLLVTELSVIRWLHFLFGALYGSSAPHLPIVSVISSAGQRDREVRLAPAVIRGNLPPDCAARPGRSLGAWARSQGREDDRTEGKRFHDALQLACVPQPRASGSIRWVFSNWKAGARAGLPSAN
jgi:hypothetical protein